MTLSARLKPCPVTKPASKEFFRSLESPDFFGSFCGTVEVGWAWCNGRTLSVDDYLALFALLGNTFGGDGVKTFKLPDLQGRVPMHWGYGNGLSQYQVGQAGGAEEVTLAADEMPAHSHAIAASSAAGTEADPTNAIPARGSSGAAAGYTQGGATGTLAAHAVSHSGGGKPHANLPPYLAVNFIIALQGEWPSRS